jgi:L-cysteine S-thiosulfotransferase
MIMREWIVRLSAIIFLALTTTISATSAPNVATPPTVSPERDRSHLIKLLQKKFPAVAVEEWSQGSQSLSPGVAVTPLGGTHATNVNDILAIGKKRWERKFANGRSFADCFAMPAGKAKTIGKAEAARARTSRATALPAATTLPMVDAQSGLVVTLEMYLQQCLTSHGEPRLDEQDPLQLGALVAYYRSIFAGQKLRVSPTTSDAAATAFAMTRYHAGREWFSRRMGERDLACASCHVLSAGSVENGLTNSPAVGQVLAWPRVEAGGQVRRLHHQFQRCMSRVGAAPFAIGSVAFNDLEYFLSALSTGLTLRPPIAVQP